LIKLPEKGGLGENLLPALVVDGQKTDSVGP